MVKIVNEIMIISEYRLKEESGNYLQASVDLAFAINLCNGSSAIANPVLETVISEEGERMSPRNNLIVKIGTKYYNFTTKKFGITSAISNATTSYNEDMFDGYLIPNQEYRLTPTNKCYTIRDSIFRDYVESLRNRS